MTQELSTKQGGYTSNFGYDAVGNPTTFKGISRSYNSNNQFTRDTFDGNGNPTTYNGAALTFDGENRALSFGSVSTETYRADGLRASKTVGSATTYYLYDGGEPVVELNSSGTVTKVNIFAPDGLVASGKGSTWTQYLFDQQGSVSERLDSSQNISSHSTYDAYGVETSTSTPTDEFGFNARRGYIFDRESGLYLCQHRYYDPGTGRWVTRDPIGVRGGLGLYGYGVADPSSVDQSGLSPFDGLQILGSPDGDAIVEGGWSVLQPHEPSVGEDVVPVYGDGVRAINDAHEGRYGWAAICAIGAGVDAVTLGADTVAEDAAKVGAKVGAHAAEEGVEAAAEAAKPIADGEVKWVKHHLYPQQFKRYFEKS